MRYAFKSTKASPPRLAKAGEQPSWHEATWISYHKAFSEKEEVRQLPKGVAFASASTLRVYDARIVSPEDEAAIARIDTEIARLQQEREQLIAQQFRTWPAITADDCERKIPGQTRAQALAKAKP